MNVPVPDATTLRKRLRIVRSANAHTLRQAGDAIGVSHTVITKWEEGETVPPVRLLAGLAKYLHIPLSEAMAMRDVADKAPVKLVAMTKRGRR